MPATRSKTESKSKKDSSKQLTIKGITRNKFSPVNIAQESTTESNMASKDSKAEVNNMVTRLEAKMDTILNRISQVEFNLGAKLSDLAARVTTVEGSIEKVTKNLQSTTLIANDAHFEVRKLNDKLALQEKLTKALEATVDDLQGKLKRNTLVFRGIPEGTEENASWSSCKILINSILLKYFNMENANIERAHRSPTVRDPNKETPRPVVVAFLHWEDANTILFQAPKVLKSNPVKAKDGSTLRVFVDQPYSPKITQERKKAMIKRWQIKQEHPELTVFIKYPARIFVKENEDDKPRLFKDSNI